MSSDEKECVPDEEFVKELEIETDFDEVLVDESEIVADFGANVAVPDHVTVGDGDGISESEGEGTRVVVFVIEAV